jgi:GxxExxY protein
MKITKKYVNDLSYLIVGCAIEVNKQMGPGLLESVYERCLIDELKSQNIDLESQVKIPILYKEKDLGGHLIIDILVEDLIIVELKSVDELIPIYEAQLLSYLKLTNKPKGLLINFNSTNITKSTIPLVTKLFAELPEDNLSELINKKINHH